MKNTFPTCLPLHLSPGSSNNLIAKRFSSFEKKTISSRDSISFSHTSSHLVNFSNDFFLPNGCYCGDASCHPVLTKGRSCSKTRCHTPIHWQKARNQTQHWSIVSKVPNCHFTLTRQGRQVASACSTFLSHKTESLRIQTKVGKDRCSFMNSNKSGLLTYFYPNRRSANASRR